MKKEALVMGLSLMEDLKVSSRLVVAHFILSQQRDILKIEFCRFTLSFIMKMISVSIHALYQVVFAKAWNPHTFETNVAWAVSFLSLFRLKNQRVISKISI